MMAMINSLARIADVDIDPNGVFKYILIKVKAKNGSSKMIVRGYGWAQYHDVPGRRSTLADILDRVAAKFCELEVDYDCLGGGRIDHKKDEKSILVYGYSMAFGRADHSETVKLLKAHYPGYRDQITYRNEGY